MTSSRRSPPRCRNWPLSLARRPPPISAWRARRSRVSRIATADARPCWPISASTSRSRPTIPIRPSRFPWKETRTSRLLRLLPFFWTPGWNSIQAVNKFQAEIGGPLRQGDPGVRVIERDGAGFRFFEQPPPAFEARKDEWLVVPLYHIFGSEELSRSAPAIAELSPEPYVALNPEDASRFGKEVELFGQRLPVKIATDLPKGLAGVPAGVPPFAGLDLPMWSRISRLP